MISDWWFGGGYVVKNQSTTGTCLSNRHARMWFLGVLCARHRDTANLTVGPCLMARGASALTATIEVPGRGVGIPRVRCGGHWAACSLLTRMLVQSKSFTGRSDTIKYTTCSSGELLLYKTKWISRKTSFFKPPNEQVSNTHVTLWLTIPYGSFFLSKQVTEVTNSA